MPIMHNNCNADCRQRHLYRWAGGNRNQEIRHEAFRRQSPHSKPTQEVDAGPPNIHLGPTRLMSLPARCRASYLVQPLESFQFQQ